MAHRLQPSVAERAGHRCEYCHLRSSYSELRFVCDHIIARKHGGSDESENLAYACPDCNSHKLSNIAGIDTQTKSLVALFNPRADDWNEHFRWNGAQLVGVSPRGRVTVQVLEMNNADQLRIRRALIAEGVSFA